MGTIVASKCGFAVFEDDAINSASQIQMHIDGTIERLGFAPDLYCLHRVDRGELLEPLFETCTDTTV